MLGLDLYAYVQWGYLPFPISRTWCKVKNLRAVFITHTPNNKKYADAVYYFVKTKRLPTIPLKIT